VTVKGQLHQQENFRSPFTLQLHCANVTTSPLNKWLTLSWYKSFCINSLSKWLLKWCSKCCGSIKLSVLSGSSKPSFYCTSLCNACKARHCYGKSVHPSDCPMPELCLLTVQCQNYVLNEWIYCHTFLTLPYYFWALTLVTKFQEQLPIDLGFRLNFGNKPKFKTWFKLKVH